MKGELNEYSKNYIITGDTANNCKIDKIKGLSMFNIQKVRKTFGIGVPIKCRAVEGVFPMEASIITARSKRLAVAKVLRHLIDHFSYRVNGVYPMVQVFDGQKIKKSDVYEAFYHTNKKYMKGEVLEGEFQEWCADACVSYDCVVRFIETKDPKVALDRCVLEYERLSHRPSELPARIKGGGES